MKYFRVCVAVFATALSCSCVANGSRSEKTYFLKTLDFAPVSFFTAADIDGAPGMEVIAVSDGSVTAYDYRNEKVIWKAGEKFAGKENYASLELPHVEDIDGDGKQEIIVVEIISVESQTQERIVALSASDGSIKWASETGGYLRGLATGDLDGDGIPEIAYTASGRYKPEGKDNFPIRAISGTDGHLIWSSWVSGNNYSSPIIRDVNGDGKGEVILLSHYYPETKEHLYCFSAEGRTLWVHRLPGMSYSSPIAMDFMGNGEIQIAAGGSSEYLLVDGKTGLPVWRHKTGGLAGHLFSLWDAGAGDLNSDGLPDIAFVREGKLSALEGRSGNILWEKSLELPGLYQEGPVYCRDFDDDGEIEIIACVNSEYFHVLKIFHPGGDPLGEMVLPSIPYGRRFFNIAFDLESRSLMFFSGKNRTSLHILSGEKIGQPIFSSSDAAAVSLSPLPPTKEAVPSSEEYSCYPLWSADGKRLAFQSYSKTSIKIPAGRQGRESFRKVVLDVYDFEGKDLESRSIDVENKHAVVLFPLWIEGQDVGLLINDSDYKTQGRWVGISSAGPRKIVEKYSNSFLFQLTKPIWGKNGDLYFSDFNEGLHRINPSSGMPEKTILAPDLGGFNYQASPALDQICFASGKDGFSLWVTNTDGTGLSKIQGRLKTYPFPSWSSDGHRIVYCCSKDGKVSILEYDLETGSRRELVKDEFDNFNPALDPGQKWLAYCSRRGLRLFIVLMDLENGKKYLLTECSVIDPRLVWDPSGRSIAFTDRVEGGQRIFLLDAGALALSKKE
jgi:outer membrane protein assembly factor BamB